MSDSRVGGGGEGTGEGPRSAPGHPWPGGPTEGPWLTLYFLPGLHEVGLDFLMKTNRSNHITGEAVVFGTLSKDPNEGVDGKKIHIYNDGTLTGYKLPHHSDSDILVENIIKIKSVKTQSQFLF